MSDCTFRITHNIILLGIIIDCNGNIILSQGGLKPPPSSLRYPCAACKPIIDVLYYIILSLHGCNQSSTDAVSRYIIIIGIYEHNILIPKGSCRYPPDNTIYYDKRRSRSTQRPNSRINYSIIDHY